MATGQHRCVFVGNIPYDATEEQLVEICQEVGPVVSFRLVIDRETGKPKGYGFCEYKDEETALSARRNLQGYEINGRQLRVDFAENDKASDRSREQARGGPGIATSTDLSKQVGPALVVGDPTHHQPIGLQIAITAATVMAGVLGGAQASNKSQLALANDPLTLHLAKLSRNQLNEIISDVKVMATQNKESAHQLLVRMPQLSKALFQAQIMLGMVTPEVLQTPNLVQTSGNASQIPSHSAMLPNVKEGQVSTIPQNPITRTQISAPTQIPMQSRVQLPLHPNNDHTLQQTTSRPNSLVSPFPTIQPHSSNSLSIRPQIPLPNPSLNQQIQPSSLNGLVYNSQTVRSNVPVQPSRIPIPSMLDTRYQPGPSMAPGILQPSGRDPAQAPTETTWANQNTVKNSNFPRGLANEKRPISDPTESVYHPAKKVKHDVGTLPVSNIHNANGSAQPQVTSQTPVSQTQLPSGVESALLQQVLNLTPEQLSLLSPEQKQEVIQLQEMLRREQIQPL